MAYVVINVRKQNDLDPILVKCVSVCVTINARKVQPLESIREAL